MKPVYKLLKEARDLIKSPDNWTKGLMSYEEEFCLLGALRHVDAQRMSNHYYVAISKIYQNLPRSPGLTFTSGESGVAEFNDSPKTKHADIIKVLNKAIRASR